MSPDLPAAPGLLAPGLPAVLAPGLPAGPMPPTGAAFTLYPHALMPAALIP